MKDPVCTKKIADSTKPAILRSTILKTVLYDMMLRFFITISLLKDTKKINLSSII